MPFKPADKAIARAGRRPYTERHRRMTVVATTAPLFTRLPAGLFASVMGLSGLALAWRVAAETFPVSPWIGDALSVLSLAVFLLLDRLTA